MLSGCWTLPTKTTTRLELTPDYLLESPCDAVRAGKTVESLAEGYVTNTKCLKLHKELLEKQKMYKKQIEEVYGN
jgi:hypothetical protein